MRTLPPSSWLGVEGVGELVSVTVVGLVVLGVMVIWAQCMLS